MNPSLDSAKAEETISGVVENIIYESDDGGFAVFRVRPRDGASITVTVQAPAPLVGQEVALSGEWVTHPRFGLQLRATSISVSAPTSVEGIERFLASGAVDGIGPAVARRIVAAFGADALDIIEKNPARLTEISGIGKKTADKIHRSYIAQGELREIMVWLETHGVSGVYAARVFKEYGSFAVEVMEKTPYRLARDVKGIGFRTADAIARGAFPSDDPTRVQAGVEFVLASIASSGNSCVPEGWLLREAARLLGVGEEAVSEAARSGLDEGRVYKAEMGDETYLYPAYLYEAETETAARLMDIQRRADVFLIKDAEAIVSKWEHEGGLTLAKGQRDAIMGALYHGVFVLTGGPGTGKTTVIRGMTGALASLGLTVRLTAPTGRAAKRLSEATGEKAETIHRLLGAQGPAQDDEPLFSRDEDEPVEADVIIIDEVSMMDIVLARYLLAAVPRGCHLILVGDANQLPSVGPGAVLKEVLRSRSIPSLALTEIFRQAGESAIVMGAHAINSGRLPALVPGSAFEMREAASAEESARIIVDLCTDELAGEGRDVLRDVQVLSPMHRFACGVERLNKLLQDALNPASPEKNEHTSGQTLFREGDKVMQVKNDYNRGVFNGDIGFVARIEDGTVFVDFDDGALVDYGPGELSGIRPAFCMSVHKSQGSEYPVIVLPLVPEHRVMLQRNLLYTAVTRAKERVILVGSRAALRSAVMNDRTRRRYTLLAERLAGALD